MKTISITQGFWMTKCGQKLPHLLKSGRNEFNSVVITFNYKMKISLK